MKEFSMVLSDESFFFYHTGMLLDHIRRTKLLHQLTCVIGVQFWFDQHRPVLQKRTKFKLVWIG